MSSKRIIYGKPTITEPIQKRPRSDKKLHLKPYINEAKRYYLDDYLLWTNRHKNKALGSIKFYHCLDKYYEGESIDEIAFRMQLSPHTIQGRLRQVENRVEIYAKMKGLV